MHSIVLLCYFILFLLLFCPIHLSNEMPDISMPVSSVAPDEKKNFIREKVQITETREQFAEEERKLPKTVHHWVG